MSKKSREYKFNYEFLKNLIDRGLTTEQIGKEIGFGKRQASYIIKKFGLSVNPIIIRHAKPLKLCKNCGKNTKNDKFCCRSCSASYNNKNTPPKRKTKKVCSKCDKLVKSYRHTMCEEHWIQYLSNKKEITRELTLGDYWSKQSLEGLHISSKNAHIRGLARSWFKDLIKQPCAKCGYDKHVELCHIKALKNFDENAKLKEVNGADNIIQLCPNCHWEFDRGLFTLQDINWFPHQDSNLEELSPITV